MQPAQPRVTRVAPPRPTTTAAPVIPAPAIDPASSLGSALTECEKLAEGADAGLTLPGANGEVKLDRCYRGRDNMVCSFNALLNEAKSLFHDYGRIVDSDYPNVSNVAAVCSLKPDHLSMDLQNAGAFDTRFKALKAEYDSRASCANRVQQSLRDVTLPDMARAPDILKSMTDSLQGDMKDVAAVQAQVLDLADKIGSAQKAMVTIRKIYRAMCTGDQPATAGAEAQGISR